MKSAAALIVVMTLSLAACDSQPAPDAPPAGARAADTPVTTEAPRSEAVTAVLQSQGTPVARLIFLIEARPVAGQPFPLKLTVSAGEPLPALQLVAESANLIVAPANAQLSLEAAGTPVVHELIVTAQQAGVTELTVRLRAGEGPEAVYSIPVLVAAAG